MAERVGRHARPYSRRLPPLEAWKKPDKWLNLETGLASRYASKLYLYPDERGSLMPDAVVSQVKEQFFWDDYDWPFDADDPETKPDDHHMHYERRLYDPANFDGEGTAREFRQLPSMIGRMPRQFHNTIHDLTMMPEIPEIEAMREYVESYKIAQQVFKQLYHSAEIALSLRRQFSPLDDDDVVGEAILRSTFSRQFAEYSAAVDEFNDLKDKSILDTRLETAPLRRPRFVIQKLGDIANRQFMNMTPLLTRAA